MSFQPKQGLFILTDCEMGCAPFWKKLTEYMRNSRHYCNALCYQASVDRSALGRAGGSAPHTHDRDKLFARSQKGGLARARNQPRARLQEIAMMGVRARKPLTREQQRERAIKSAASRFGLLPRNSPWHAASPGLRREGRQPHNKPSVLKLAKS